MNSYNNRTFPAHVVSIYESIIAKYNKTFNQAGINSNISFVGADVVQIRIRSKFGKRNKKNVRIRLFCDESIKDIRLSMLTRTYDIVTDINEVYKTVRAYDFMNANDLMESMDDVVNWLLTKDESTNFVAPVPDLVPVDFNDLTRTDVLYYGIIESAEINKEQTSVKLTLITTVGKNVCTLELNSNNLTLFKPGKILLINYRKDIRVMRLDLASSLVNITENIYELANQTKIQKDS